MIALANDDRENVVSPSCRSPLPARCYLRFASLALFADVFLVDTVVVIVVVERRHESFFIFPACAAPAMWDAEGKEGR